MNPQCSVLNERQSSFLFSTNSAAWSITAAKSSQGPGQRRKRKLMKNYEIEVLKDQTFIIRETLSIKYLRRAVIIYNLRKQKENGNLKDGT